MALAFSRITEGTAARIIELRKADPSELSEHSLAYTRHWVAEIYRIDFAETSGCGVLRTTLHGRHYYSLPFGPGDKAAALAEVRAQEPGRLMLGVMTEEQAADLAAKGWLVRENGWGFDYVYARHDLAELKGSRYQSKRNFCHRFEKAGDWRYGPLDVSAALKVLADWREAKGTALDEEAGTEYRALLQDLPAASIGGVLYQGERPVAFAIGERLSDEMILVSYEKALADVSGSFQMINREFARREGAGYRWINRASADGHPALVKAKESYHPSRRLRKFLAIDPFLSGTESRIVRATAADAPEIVSLWQDVFGDTEPFIRSVVESNPGFLIRDAHGLAAMGFALERDGARYVYALATRPDCRRCGFATAILDTIWLAFPMERLALVPGTPGLIPFYERRGFSVASTGAYVTMTRPPAPGYRVPDPMN